MTKIRDVEGRIRVLIVDDHAVIRRVVRTLLESLDRFQVCGEGATGAEGVQLAEELLPDVVVINISMPQMDGFTAAHLIHVAHPRCAIVILSSHKDKQLVAYAQKIGVQGFVDKGNTEAELINTIEEAEIGEAFAVAE